MMFEWTQWSIHLTNSWVNLNIERYEPNDLYRQLYNFSRRKRRETYNIVQ